MSREYYLKKGLSNGPINTFFVNISWTGYFLEDVNSEKKISGNKSTGKETTMVVCNEKVVLALWKIKYKYW